MNNINNNEKLPILMDTLNKNIDIGNAENNGNNNNEVKDNNVENEKIESNQIENKKEENEQKPELSTVENMIVSQNNEETNNNNNQQNHKNNGIKMQLAKKDEDSDYDVL